LLRRYPAVLAVDDLVTFAKYVPRDRLAARIQKPLKDHVEPLASQRTLVVHGYHYLAVPYRVDSSLTHLGPLAEPIQHRLERLDLRLGIAFLNVE